MEQRYFLGEKSIVFNKNKDTDFARQVQVADLNYRHPPTTSTHSTTSQVKDLWRSDPTSTLTSLQSISSNRYCHRMEYWYKFIKVKKIN